MAYSKKTWVDRTTEYPNRRILTPTSTADEYEVSRAEGVVLNEGDAFNAATMNDLEERVEAGIANAPFATSAQGTKADNAMPKSGGQFTDNVQTPYGGSYTGSRVLNAAVRNASGTLISGTHYISFQLK